LTALVSVDNGETVSTSHLRVSIACVGSPSGTCPCECTYGVDPDCTCRDLTNPVEIHIAKTALRVTYPLTYDRSYPGSMFETYVVTGSGGDRSGSCRDAPGDDEPTCGWVLDEKSGNHVADSQGFCCSCSIADGIMQSLPWTKRGASRGDLSCGLLQHGLWLGGVPASAHCLNWSSAWYHGYRVGQARLDFQVEVSMAVPVVGEEAGSEANSEDPPPDTSNRALLSTTTTATTTTTTTDNTSGGLGAGEEEEEDETRGTSDSGGTNDQDVDPEVHHDPDLQPMIPTSVVDLTVNPHDPITRSPTGEVVVKLLGDLVGYTEFPVLSEKFLFLPASKDVQDPDPLAWAHQSEPWNWLLVDQNLVSQSGTDCDRIGTGFSAFRNQGSPCQRELGTCLRGQILDLWKEDEERIRQGTVPRHRLHGYYRGVDPASWYRNTYDQEDAGWRIALPYPETRSSMLYLELKADHLAFVKNKSSGRIEMAAVCQFGAGAEVRT
jgi:hypothetical protein